LLSSACNYIILSEVLPCIWKEDGKDDYFPLMAELGRIFEHTKVMEKHVYPVIEEAIHPDDVDLCTCVYGVVLDG